MNTLRYLHLVIGIAALITGLANTLSFLVQSNSLNLAGNSLPGLVALFTGLLNLQQFNTRPRADGGVRRALNMVAATLIVLSALVPLAGVWVPAVAAFIGYAIGLAIGAVCLATAMVLLSQLQQLSFKLPGRQSNREAGTVKWFNTNKGFGFISRDQGDDVFVHFRAIRGEGHRALEEGQRVEFVVARREKGLQAEDVVIL
ncbi:cold-shock protein [Halopseudomonas sp.]|uniref:cold-shock protein n=1 Tax=Halopseudomonas sp. TaxID=2901191 RepID=UPI003002416D